MRKSFPKLVGEGSEVVGISFGADFTAEHEWGIGDIRTQFGINHEIEVYGVKKRIITRIPEHLFQFSEGFALSYAYLERKEELTKHHELSIWKKEETLAAAWDEKSFAVRSVDSVEAKQLDQIYEHFASLDIIIMLGGAKHQWLDNPGLMIGIASKMPQSVIDIWEKTDREQHQIQIEFKASGIEDLLRKNGKKYFALSPRRDPKDGGLIFWLNPMEQKQNNCGWFKLEDLQQWAEGKGKIPIVKEQKVGN